MRASVLGSSPAYPLEVPVTFVVAGPLGSVRLTIAGPPETWVDAINAREPVTGVEALLTDAETTLEDGTTLDPAGDRYLLLFTRGRGQTNRLDAGVTTVADGTGFTMTHSAGEGRDERPTRPEAFEQARTRAATAARADSRQPAPSA
jgi:hypothetical protein